MVNEWSVNSQWTVNEWSMNSQWMVKVEVSSDVMIDEYFLVSFPSRKNFSTHFFFLDNFCGDTFQQMDDHQIQT